MAVVPRTVDDCLGWLSCLVHLVSVHHHHTCRSGMMFSGINIYRLDQAIFLLSVLRELSEKYYMLEI